MDRGLVRVVWALGKGKKYGFLKSRFFVKA